MSIVRIQHDRFDELAIQEFWRATLDKLCPPISVTLNTETATLEAKGRIPEARHPDLIHCVHLNAYEVMLRWDDLAESALSDDEFKLLVEQEAQIILENSLSHAPEGLELNVVLNA